MGVLLCAALLVSRTGASAADFPGSRVVRGVVADGACAIHGMSAEQSQLIALQKARSSAIERAAGVRVASSTLVRDGAVAVDLIRTYSRGFIVAERAEWLPLAQYQDSPDWPPIPEYRVRIVADVAIPERVARPLGLEAKLDNKVCRKGEKARLEIGAGRDARVAVFNITADDRVVMLFPHPLERDNRLPAGKRLSFPPAGSALSLVMVTLPGHAKDAEAFFIAAVGAEEEIDFLRAFGGEKAYPLTAFFGKYAEIAPRADDVILPYAVEGSE